MCLDCAKNHLFYSAILIHVNREKWPLSQEGVLGRHVSHEKWAQPQEKNSGNTDNGDTYNMIKSMFVCQKKITFLSCIKTMFGMCSKMFQNLFDKQLMWCTCNVHCATNHWFNLQSKSAWVAKMTTFPRRLVLGPMWVTKNEHYLKKRIPETLSIKEIHFLGGMAFLSVNYVPSCAKRDIEKSPTMMTMTSMVWKDFSGSIAPLIVGSTQQGTTYTLWSLLQIPFRIGFLVESYY